MRAAPECPACGARRHAPSWIGAVRFEEFAYGYLRCDGCASLFADPMPSVAWLERIYAPDYVQAHYSSELAGESSSLELAEEQHAVLDEIARVAAPGSRLLDVGCGAGRFLVEARARGFRPEGHEPSPATAAMVASVTGMPVSSGSLASAARDYGIVHLADVLEHVPAPLALLADAAERLAAGGKLILRGPLENQPNLFHTLVRWRRRRSSSTMEMPPYHLMQFSLRGWHALIARAGLRVVEERVREVRWPAPPRPSLSAIAIAKKLSRALSASPIGRRWKLGNRVVTIAEASAPAS